MERLLHRLKQLFPGVVRKVAIPFFVLATAGWLLVVIGFGLGADNGEINRDQPTSYPFWVVSIGGPVVIAVGVVHAALSQRYSRFIGLITSLLSVLFITGLGMILYNTGDYIRLVNENNILFPNRDWVNIEFAGALIATFSWTAVMMLWHFYDYNS